MRVPLEWLKQYVAIEATAEEIGVRLTMGGLEVEGMEESALGPVLDVYITPNRGDCLSMVGVAREVAALYDLPLNVPAPPQSEENGEIDSLTSVTVEAPDLCPRFAARMVRGVKIGPSPEWMQARLEAAGMRAVNNVVDVTNYVMLELGQPLHAYDFDGLAGGRLVIRRANNGETLETLDGVARTLDSSMLVIADAGKPVGVAGIMGGLKSEVSDNTTNLLLESAHFDGLAIRRASRNLGLRTEASYRFERVVDPTICRLAVDRACELLTEMGQPEAVSGVIDVHEKEVVGRDISLRVSRAAELLGMTITADIAADCLRRLELPFTVDGDMLRVHVPPRRSDLTIEEDLIEEVGRIYGYENIPETLPIGSATQGGDSADGKFIRQIRQILASCGLQEVVTHSLTAPSFFDSPADAERRVSVRNALSSDVGGLRRSLIPSILDVAQRNVSHGQKALGLFEIGRVWQNQNVDGATQPVEYIAIAGFMTGTLQEANWQRDGKTTAADFSAIRGVVETLLSGLGAAGAKFAPLGQQAATLPQFHPGRAALLHLGGETAAGVLGELHPNVSAKYDLRERAYTFEVGLTALEQSVAASKESAKFVPLSRFPAISRDLAPRLPEAVLYAEVEDALDFAAAPFLEAVKLTDVFRGGPLPPDVKSFTLALTFRSPDRTLSDGEVSASLATIRAALETKCGATFAA